MANAQYVISNADVGGTAFTVPGDQDGGENDASFKVESRPQAHGKQWYAHVQNGFDQNVDVTLRGSHYLDEDMSAAAADGPSETINSGESGTFDGVTGHTYIEVQVTPAADPTSGNLTVTFQSRDE